MARSQMNILTKHLVAKATHLLGAKRGVLELDGWKLSSLELSEFTSPTPQFATKSLKSIYSSIQRVQSEVL